MENIDFEEIELFTNKKDQPKFPKVCLLLGLLEIISKLST